jgi:hypothetical protein
MENLRFLIAHRRNAQKRGGGAFLMRLSAWVGPDVSKLTFVDPKRSVLLQKKVYEEIKTRLDQGSLRRLSAITAWSDVQAILQKMEEQFNGDKMVIWLSHEPDFMFEQTFVLETDPLSGQTGYG